MLQTGEDENELRTYLTKMLDRETFDGTGLIYGMAMLFIPCPIHVV